MDLAELLQQFVDTVQDPTADPRRTVVLIAIGLVAFLVFAVVVFMLLPSEKRDEEEEDWAESGPAVTPRDGRSHLLTGITLVLVLAVVAGLAYADRWSRQDQTCGRCHAVEPAIASAAAGSHPEVACIDCHASPGALGGVETRVRAVANLLADLDGTATPDAPVTVDTEGCRDCHEEVSTGVLVVDRLRVRHQDFIDDVPCAQCHGDVGHAPPGGVRGALPAVMTTCADCHEGQTAGDECATCHVGDIAYAGEGPEAYARVQLASPTTCRGCHSLEGCTDCHGIEMPHPVGWGDPRMHAPRGAFDTGVCDRCHEAGCFPCHSQIHVAHGPGWRAEHATADRSICTNCHDGTKVGRDMCRLCHT